MWESLLIHANIKVQRVLYLPVTTALYARHKYRTDLKYLHFSPLAVGIICNSSSSLVIAVAPSDYRSDMILRVYPLKFTCYIINVVNHDALLNSVFII